MTIAQGQIYGPNSELVERLLSDCRVLGPSGVERIAWGTQKAHISEAEPEHVALEAIRSNGLERAWQAAEAAVRHITEGSTSAPAWKAEQEGTRRTAEDAALHAAMAVIARNRLDHEIYRALVKPMSEALPWLLPDEMPDEYRASDSA